MQFRRPPAARAEMLIRKLADLDFSVQVDVEVIEHAPRIVIQSDGPSPPLWRSLAAK